MPGSILGLQHNTRLIQTLAQSENHTVWTILVEPLLARCGPGGVDCSPVEGQQLVGIEPAGEAASRHQAQEDQEPLRSCDSVYVRHAGNV